MIFLTYIVCPPDESVADLASQAPRKRLVALRGPGCTSPTYLVGGMEIYCYTPWKASNCVITILGKLRVNQSKMATFVHSLHGA